MEDIFLDFVKAKDVANVENLIKKGVDINHLFEDVGVDAIGWAVSENDVEMVKLLIKYDVEINRSYDKKKISLLHLASSKLEISKLLIEKGITIDSTDYFGNTPLWAALHEKNYEVAELLLQHGADPNKKNRVGEILVGKKKQPLGESKSPLTSSQDNGDFKALELFEKYKDIKHAK
jgi:ankyrin repeat protein